MCFFDHNYQLFHKRYPLLALLLLKQPKKQISFLQGGLDSQYFEKEVLFIYGIGNYYKEIAPFLNAETKKVVYLEEDLGYLSAFLAQSFAKELILNPQIEFVYLSDKSKEQLKMQIWKHLFQKQAFIPDPSRPDQSQILSNICEELFHGIHLTASEYSDFGIKVMRNIFLNLLSEPIYEANHLYGKFKKVPALILGAGPSLEHGLEHLAQNRPQGILIGAGAAAGILAEYNIAVDFSVQVDADPDPVLFDKQRRFEIPLFCQMRFSHSRFKSVEAKKFLLGHSGAHPLEEYLFQKLQIHDVFEAGWNAANSGASLAVELGCDPIVFLGMDHAYSNGKEYSMNLQAKERDRISLIQEDGKTIQTRRDLFMGMHFLKDLAALHQDRHFINCSKGGLPIPGIPNCPFDKILQKYFAYPRDIKQKIQDVISHVTPLAITSSLQDLLLQFQQSLIKTQHLVDALLDTLKKEEGKMSFLTFELEEQHYYQKVLKPLWNIWKYPILRIKRSDPFLAELIFYKEVIKEYQNLFSEVLGEYAIRNDS